MPVELKAVSTFSTLPGQVSCKTKNFEVDRRWRWQWEVVLKFGPPWQGGEHQMVVEKGTSGWKRKVISLGQWKCVRASARACVHALIGGHGSAGIGVPTGQGFNSWGGQLIMPLWRTEASETTHKAEGGCYRSELRDETQWYLVVLPVLNCNISAVLLSLSGNFKSKGLFAFKTSVPRTSGGSGSQPRCLEQPGAERAGSGHFLSLPLSLQLVSWTHEAGQTPSALSPSVPQYRPHLETDRGRGPELTPSLNP